MFFQIEFNGIYMHEKKYFGKLTWSNAAKLPQINCKILRASIIFCGNVLAIFSFSFLDSLLWGKVMTIGALVVVAAVVVVVVALFWILFSDDIIEKFRKIEISTTNSVFHEFF